MVSYSSFKIWVQVKEIKEWVEPVLKRTHTQEWYNTTITMTTSLISGSIYLLDIVKAWHCDPCFWVTIPLIFFFLCLEGWHWKVYVILEGCWKFVSEVDKIYRIVLGMIVLVAENFVGATNQIFDFSLGCFSKYLIPWN